MDFKTVLLLIGWSTALLLAIDVAIKNKVLNEIQKNLLCPMLVECYERGEITRQDLFRLCGHYQIDFDEVSMMVNRNRQLPQHLQFR